MRDDSVWTLVTGGAKRLGSCLCLELASRGHNVVIHYRNSRNEALLLSKELQSYGVHSEIIQGDFSSGEGCIDFIRRYKDCFPLTKNLINNVGNYYISSFEKTPFDIFQLLFQTNVHAPFLLMQELLASIRIHKGSIINIGTASILQGRADTNSGVYTATKAALWSLTKSVARECAPDQVAVNMVSPGQLDISVSLPSDLSILPMKRAGTCAEVARVVGFLLQPENHYITAQNIEIAGACGL
jgi:3-oxoacyl-[acyl-carrier protein] reductase